MEDWSFNATYSGTPQGGVVSPILANIYLHELDQFLTEMKARFDRGKRRAENPRYRNLTIQLYYRRLRIERLTAEGRLAEVEDLGPRSGRLRRNAPPCRRGTGSTRTSSGSSSAVTRTTVCHERTYERRCGAVQEMEVGPPEPAVRGRLQTTASCDGQEPWW